MKTASIALLSILLAAGVAQASIESKVPICKTA